MADGHLRPEEGSGYAMLAGLRGKSVVVTGGAGVIGSAVSRRLAAEGALVVVADLDADAAKTVAELIGGAAVGVGVDITTPLGAQASVDAAVQAFGKLDLYHANAGVECAVRTVADFDPADYHRVFGVNVLGVFLSAQAAVRQLSAQGDGGSILFTASIAALMGSAGTSVYNASKHAVQGIARCLAVEVAGAGIRVNTLAPGVVESRMMDALGAGLGALVGADGATARSGMEAAVPLGRYATPEEIAATAAWILSDEVPYLHNECITVSGGIAPY
ncbi:SDR family NAD(P)-dependent oxidoreductase [Frankia sp. Cr1]|uniref:SDR family NAD(P)-dependent oxidoreductase n=1 Tax=Frankia sp. Cr1 TaxID=3073931 RepID=UPI002AD52647|nr:SDR family oxidoreductase [Frankia sp. Cr1]